MTEDLDAALVALEWSRSDYSALTALRNIQHIIELGGHKTEEDLNDLLTEKRPLILETFVSYPDNAHVQQIALKILQKLHESRDRRSDDQHTELRLIAGTIVLHISSEDLVTSALDYMHSLSRFSAMSVDSESEMPATRDCNLSILSSALEAIENYPRNSRINIFGVQVIANLVHDSHLPRDLTEYEVSCVVCSMITNETDLLRTGLEILRTVLPTASESILIRLAVDHGFHGYICQKLEDMSPVEHEKLAITCIEVILPFTSVVGLDLLQEYHLLKTTLDIISEENCSSNVQLVCFRLLRMLIPYARTEELNLPILISHMHSTMIATTDQGSAQKICCQTIVALLKRHPQCKHFIGEDSGQYPLHSAAFGVLLSLPCDREAVSTACRALYWLSINDDAIQDALIMKNTHLALLPFLQSHEEDANLCECVCMLLKSLCRFRSSLKTILVNDGVTSMLLAALFPFSKFPETLVEILGALACFAEIDSSRQQCIKEGLDKLMLFWMTPDNMEEESLMEACIETLIVLSSGDFLNETSTDAQLDILKEDTITLTMVFDIMGNFEHVEAMQFKCLILTQLILEELAVLTINQSHHLVEVVIQAMKSHTSSLAVQCETCVCIQMACKLGGAQTGLLFLDYGVTECLFDLYSTSHSELHALANGCLHQLSYDLDLLTLMLLKACRDGNELVAETLLSLGANVNTGSGRDTPVCHAISHRKFNLTKAVLEKGVRNLDSAIRLCKEQHLHHYLGLVLSHCGVNKKGQTISWSGIGIGEMRLEWLCPSLIGPLKCKRSKTAHISEQIADDIRANHKTITQNARSVELTSNEAMKSQTAVMRMRNCREACSRATSEHTLLQTGENGRDLASSETTDMRRNLSSLSSISTFSSDSEDYYGVYTHPPQSRTDCFVTPNFLETWRRMSLSGSDIPFAKQDPRICSSSANINEPPVTNNHECVE